MFAGINAIGANIILLTEASLKIQYVPADVVIRNTGWFCWLDEKWRFEIPDDSAELLFLPDSHCTCPLPKVLWHPVVYNAYPHLRDVQVEFNNSIPGAGSFGIGIYSLRIPPLIRIKRYRSEKAILSTILHEVQHAIQAIERFSPGCGKCAIKAYEVPASSEKDFYLKCCGEVEARITQARHALGHEERKHTPINAHQDVPSSDILVLPCAKRDFFGRDVSSGLTNITTHWRLKDERY